MPLPSVLKGTLQCKVLTKRTKQRCKNPCAFGSKKACRMHGSHRSKNVLREKLHPQYKNGERIKAAEDDHRRASITLLTLRDLGDYLNMFNGTHIRGRKPNGYIKYDMTDPKQLGQALLALAKLKKVKP